MNNTELICRSEYVAMRDGIRLAVSTWLANDKESDNEKHTDKRPAIVITTRYWRAMAFKQDKPEFQGNYPLACYLWARGYVLVVADARGSGESVSKTSDKASGPLSPSSLAMIPRASSLSKGGTASCKARSSSA